MAKKTEKDVQKDLKESAHKIWLAGLGALATVGEEGGKLFDSLVARGEKFEARGKKQMEKAKGKIDEAKGKAESFWGRFEDTLDDKVASALKRVGVPTRNEIQTLSRRVSELTAKVEQLRHRAPRKPAVKATHTAATK